MSLTSAEKEANQKALLTMVALTGGPDGYRAKSLSLRDFFPILDADPSDDLSGLRLIAERMYPSPLPKDKPSDDEPLLSPHIAEDWLIRGRRIRNREGILILDADDHLSMAGFRIATSLKPQKLSEIYAQTSNNVSPIKPWAISDIAKEVIADYKSRNPKP